MRLGAFALTVPFWTRQKVLSLLVHRLGHKLTRQKIMLLSSMQI